MSHDMLRQRWPLLAALAAIAACSDQTTLPLAAPSTSSNIARTHCDADVRTRTVTCGTGTSARAGSVSASLSPSSIDAAGVAGDHIFGGQGQYVNLVSSNVSYVAQVFAFDATVQNVSDLAMGTANGSTRDDAGLQIFINSGPVQTGGSGVITVQNATGTSTFLSSNQSYYQYGGKIGGVDQPELGGDGILSSVEVSSGKTWQFFVPSSVTSFSFDVYVSTKTAAGPVSTIAPQISGIAPATLVPGSSATITGSNFNAAFAANSVTIGGRSATVTGGSTTSLTVTVPCVASGTLPVYVTAGGTRGSAFSHPLAVTQRAVSVGQAVVATSAIDAYCNELTSAGGTARYLVSVFNVNSSPSNNAPFQFSADNLTSAPVVAASRTPSISETILAAQDRLRAREHNDLLEKNAEAYVGLRARFGRVSTIRMPSTVQRFAGAPPTRNFRISNLNATSPNNICNSFYVVSARLVYDSGKLAIYEDDATAAAFQSALSPTMAAYYQAIGDQFNSDMEPIIRNNFGDPLRRDAVTDNNGQVVALFTPRINNSFAPRAGFVVSCDQYPNDDVSGPAVGGPYTGSAGSANGASNFGEVFYANQPTDDVAGYTGNSPGNWFRSIRSTFIHETKHSAAYSARVANGSPQFEVSWLEEGTARHAEELWMRNVVDNVAWKGNTGYGSASTPINLYCDVRTPPSWPACGNGKRPASIMYNHFSSLYTYMSGNNPSLMSPFGPSPADNGSYFYAISWSLVRYAIDRYGASDAVFLTALTQATTTGATNLSARTGVSIDQLLGGWGLALYADDFPGLASPSADIQFPTWNIRDIYAGLNSDFTGYPYPLVPTALTFGASAPLSSATLRGGGLKHFEFSGTQSAAQLLRLETDGGGLPLADLRIAITRIQ
ncbi:MAG: IPT/TIG domain-containing protein [bacterium]